MLIPGAWAPLLQELMENPETEKLLSRVRAARESREIYPPEGLVFNALRETPPDRIRAVILGQDPYHEPGQAMGLAFSVAEGTAIPPSLRNIYKELESDLGLCPPEHGNLTAWARQGVLLLNTVLTVERGRANSHSSWGWQAFTDQVIRRVNSLPQPVAFVLWGGQARKKEALLSRPGGPRLILRAPHPSPLSSYRGFFGSRPFSRINTFLTEQGEKPIDWRLP